MKKRFLILGLIVLTLIAIITFFFVKNTTVEPPEHLSNIPEQAKWIGGADGGNWFEVVKVLGASNFRIKIYNENTGETEADTTFILNPECVLGKIDSSTLVQSIEGYDGNRIILSIPKNEQRCFLTPQ